MKTVLVDNSLCVYTLCDDADEEYIYNYIRALGAAGVRYVEIDFRTLMKLHTLPENVGYIFRLVDPMFMGLTEVYKFDYMLLTPADIRKKIKTPIPVMLGLPVTQASRKFFQYAGGLLDGQITAVRVRGSIPMMSPENAGGYVRFLKNEFPVPVDVCPLNDQRAALDAAVKLSRENIDSLTLTMGAPERYCSLDEYLFTMLTVFDRLPLGVNIHALCRAAVFQRFIFKNCRGADGMLNMLDIVDHDIHFLRNADTGARVPLKVSLKEAAYIKRTFVSALERMAKAEEIPPDVFEDLTEAMRRFDVSLFDEKLMENRQRTFLN